MNIKRRMIFLVLITGAIHLLSTDNDAHFMVRLHECVTKENTDSMRIEAINFLLATAQSQSVYVSDCIVGLSGVDDSYNEVVRVASIEALSVIAVKFGEHAQDCIALVEAKMMDAPEVLWRSIVKALAVIGKKHALWRERVVDSIQRFLNARYEDMPEYGRDALRQIAEARRADRELSLIVPLSALDSRSGFLPGCLHGCVVGHLYPV